MDEERASIARYQKAKGYLPIVETVAGLTPVDFDHAAYPEYSSDKLAALDLYLKELLPYTQRLVKAAQLRQEHYDHFIARYDRKEEPGHQAWREEMNKLARECQSLVDYWKRQRELEFDKAVVTSEKRARIVVDLSVRNIEYDPKEKPKKYSVARPRLPDVEKKRRKKELKQRKREAEILVEKTIKEIQPVYAKIGKFHDIESRIITVEEALVLCDEISRQIFESGDPSRYTRQFYQVTVKDSVLSRKKLFFTMVSFFLRLYLEAKKSPGLSYEHKLQCLLAEFNAIYLYSRCWSDEAMIAGNCMFVFLHKRPEVVIDLCNTEMLQICEPLEKLIAAIIWPWSCEYLVEVCKNTTKIDYDNPLTPLIKNILKNVYPESYCMINRPYLEEIMRLPDPKIAALALYRKRDIRVLPPRRNIKLFKAYFGDYPFAAEFKYWRDAYRKFLALAGQDPNKMDLQ